ncbi:TRAP transporter small permease [Neoroseomonas lacus]|uniref:TRAP transporter small permease protein n=1 Tax=Neoroseomonas lacus TaxID=287609 RepID=A0A917KKM1_9PROT|nr:TRAP transporter small permease subunit [Neoroseomonas lacus]GGJ18140.1 C4-dicarboxylate ABC transporter permease [Neoroseomonas lacus]
MTGWLGRRAEDVLSALLAVMFVAFMLQIVTRYVLNAPLSWTAELSTLCWVWGILWGAGLVLRDDEEIRFDIIYGAMSGPLRRIADGITSTVVVIVFAGSLPAMVDYVTFMKVEKSAYLGIRFDILYSVYLIFAVATIIRHAATIWRVLTGRRILGGGA